MTEKSSQLPSFINSLCNPSFHSGLSVIKTSWSQNTHLGLLGEFAILVQVPF